ncbi:hypothetical protein ABT297_38415, partial [Dactylosporangium sp. NPDC000555]|uniref:hypothetical protein n=1 Tax=Dactylosporangium sp. NPDC000555 TaxID=3154260 RepID=UPI003333CABA
MGEVGGEDDETAGVDGADVPWCGRQGKVAARRVHRRSASSGAAQDGPSAARARRRAVARAWPVRAF